MMTAVTEEKEQPEISKDSGKKRGGPQPRREEGVGLQHYLGPA